MTKAELIKEIAGDLDVGFVCHYNPETNEVIKYPDPFQFGGMDDDSFADDLKKLHKNRKKFFEIEKRDSRESFEIMADFVDTVDNANPMKSMLESALQQSKPFGKFKFVIDNAGPLRDEWFAFKDRAGEEWVKEQLEVIISNCEKKAARAKKKVQSGTER